VNILSRIKPNEHTIRSYWRDILNDLLKGKNIEIIYDPTIKQRKNQRYPDFLIRDLKNKTEFILETKVGEKYYMDAVVDGIQKMNKVNADASIAVSFPKSLLEIPMNNLRAAMDEATPYKAEIRFNLNKYTKNKKRLKSSASLKNLNTFILELLLETPLKEKEELDIKSTIKSLRENVFELYESIKYLDKSDLKNILGGRTLFENVLGYGDEDLQHKQEDLFYIIAYLLLNQLLFYNVIQKYLPSLPRLSLFTISNLDDIRKRFSDVREKDWEPVFGYDILKLIIETIPNSSNLFKTIKYILQDIEELTMHPISNEILGILFHELIPLSIRKVVAAYYTGNQAGELLAWLSIDDHKTSLLDPACGSGSLLTAAYRRKRKILEESHPFTGTEHKQFVEEDIVGIDIMPFATHLTTINLSLQVPVVYTSRIRVGTEDSTKLEPGDKIHPTFDALEEIYQNRLITLDKWVDERNYKKPESIEKGPVSLNGKIAEPIVLESYDLIIMNPPFTRAENITKIKFKKVKKTKKGEKEVEITYKDVLYERFNEYKNYLDASMGLYGYFILLADRFLNKKGKIAAVLPASILRLKSTLKLRKFIIKNYFLNYIIIRKDKVAFSENTALREILFIITKKNHVDFKINCKYILIDELPDTLNEIQELSQKIKNSQANSGFTEYVYTQKEMKDMINNWFLPIFENIYLLKLWEELRKNPKLTNCFNKISKENVIRGVESPSIGSIRSVFIVDDEYSSGRDIWVYKGRTKDKNGIIAINNKFRDIDDNHLIERYEIPGISLRKAIRTPAYMPKINLKDLKDFILLNEFPNIIQFLSDGLKKSSDEMNLEFINSWISHCDARSSNLFHSRRVNLSAPGTKLLAFFSPTLRIPTKLLWSIKSIPIDTAKILTLWFNSSIHLLQIILNRIETDGAFIEIGKYTFKSIKIIDISTLSDEEKLEILNYFKKIKDIKFPCILKQLKNNFEIRKEIDDLFLKILGFEDKKKRREIGKTLRAELYKEITQLKDVMI
jgi:hypothetical protein